MLAFTLACLLLADPQPQAPAAMVQPQRLEAVLKALPTKRTPGAEDEHEAGLVQTQEWLVGEARRMGYQPQTHKVVFAKRIRPAAGEKEAPYRREWENIILQLPGKEKPEEVLIVGAHFDAVRNAPGADDNGTGVAALLEIARVLKDQPMRRTVLLILFNLEEVGLLGSSQYAKWFADKNKAAEDHKQGQQGAPPKEQIVGMLSLEMLGFYSDQPGSQDNPFPGIKGIDLPAVGDFIGLAGVLEARRFIRTLDEQMRKAEPTCKTFVFDFSPLPLPDLLRSDHAPFLLRGIPAVMVTDTANLRNQNYHEPTDTIQTLDMPRYTSTVRALAGAIHAMAGPVGQPDPAPPNLEGLPDLSTLMAPAGQPEKSPAANPGK